MNIPTAKRLRDALSAIQELEHFTAGHTREWFLDDRGLQLIVHKLLEIVGEALNAASRSDPAIASSIPDFRRIVAMRHRIVHGYDSVDYDVLWSTVQLRIPGLRGVLRDLLGDAPELPSHDAGDSS